MARNNVQVGGVPGRPVVVFSHGFGCDQHMWVAVTPHFADGYQVVLFDHVGAGASDLTAYDPGRYASLDGYAADVVEIVVELGLGPVTFVGHSVSAMIGVLAAASRPELFERLVLVGPSARYLDDGDYVGGFTAADIDEMLEAMDSNYLGWSSAMAPVITGNADEPRFGEELAASFCRTDPAIARQFAEVTFTSDSRADLARVHTPTLVLQCADDAIAPATAGRYVHEHLPHSTFRQMAATGHTPNLTAPEETARLIVEFLGS
ncbi:alpha/beta fold hydrolase [uncultured Jatrophihabitans sp.]|uniref:alpha/beta fold hydrolase n=1 Tax=uncultured Jatrophihabitans sp. TaxID=1610747 RepID=UPI0035CC1835